MKSRLKTYQQLSGKQVTECTGQKEKKKKALQTLGNYFEFEFKEIQPF